MISEVARQFQCSLLDSCEFNCLIEKTVNSSMNVVLRNLHICCLLLPIPQIPIPGVE
jgi:hypothetical protein